MAYYIIKSVVSPWGGCLRQLTFFNFFLNPLQVIMCFYTNLFDIIDGKGQGIAVGYKFLFLFLSYFLFEEFFLRKVVGLIVSDQRYISLFTLGIEDGFWGPPTIFPIRSTILLEKGHHHIHSIQEKSVLCILITFIISSLEFSHRFVNDHPDRSCQATILVVIANGANTLLYRPVLVHPQISRRVEAGHVSFNLVIK